MTGPLVVVDTNVVVSGLLTAEPEAPTAIILDDMLGGALRFVVSVELLAEYRSVLLRPGIRSRHGLTDGEVDELLTAVVENAVVCEPVGSPEPPPDPGDEHVWALLAARPGSVLVTGDRTLVENPPGWASVVTPRSFLDLV